MEKQFIEINGVNTNLSKSIVHALHSHPALVIIECVHNFHV